MGKYMKKCKARTSSNDNHNQEQVGVRTRARTLAALASPATTRKRKFDTNNIITTSSHELQSYLQLRSGKLLNFSEKQISPITTSTNDDRDAGDKNDDNCGAAHDRCFFSSDNHHHQQHMDCTVSRCSSNGSSIHVNNNNNNKNLMSASSSAGVDLIEGGGDKRFEFLDNSTHSFDSTKRRETTPSEESGDLESTERRQITSSSSSPTHQNHHTSDQSMKDRMASIESEINDFFSVAEEKEHKRFSERYNFDFARELPMEGRYEWVRLTE